MEIHEEDCLGASARSDAMISRKPEISREAENVSPSALTPSEFYKKLFTRFAPHLRHRMRLDVQ